MDEKGEIGLCIMMFIVHFLLSGLLVMKSIRL